MKSQALQQLIKKVFADEKAKGEFMANPNSVMSRYDLNEDEKKAVLSIHSRLGLVGSDSMQLEAAIDPNIVWI